MLNSLFKKLQSNYFYQIFLFGILGLIAFHKIFSFWFYHGWETSWFGSLGQKFSLLEVMKTHGLISYLNYSLFGWRPVGWFATALIFHIATAMIINLFISRKTNRTVGFVSGILFLVTTAHHDVVTWGTFESLYAAQTLCLYAGLWVFDLYMSSKRLMWYTVMIFLFLVSLIIRESGLLFIPLVFFFDLFIYGQLLLKKQTVWLDVLTRIIRRHALLWILGIGYLLLRASYGGSANDFIDERIQFSILLLHEHRYFEYLMRGLLSFGYFIGPYLVPYPIINLIRDSLLSILTFQFIKIYFFTIFGWLCYILFFSTAYRLRKSKYSKYVWFCFFSFTAITAFYAFAWSVKDSFLATAYFWSENRWRYLGFTFFAGGLSILTFDFFTSRDKTQLKKRWFKRPTFGIMLLVFYLIVNTMLLYKIEDKMYRENSLPVKLFYRDFFKKFPTLMHNDTFYAFPGSAGIGDFFAELTTTSKTYYPNLSEKPDPWVRTEMYYILRGMQTKKSWVNNVHFIDFDLTNGLQDLTTEVRTIFSQLKPLDLTVKQLDGSMSADIASSIQPVDFRYNLSVNYQAAKLQSAVNESEKARAVGIFSSELASMISDTQINVCKTVGPPAEPNFDFRKELALDGNLNYRSFWWSDCRPAWITLDMGSSTAFAGAAWASVSKPDSVPRDYHYDVSEDGKIWKQVESVKLNTQNSRFDIFPEVVNGRYLRFWVDETAYRQLFAVNEFLPLLPETMSVAKYYHDLPSLYEDMYRQAGKVSWMRLKWTTKPDNAVPDVDRTIYEPLVTDGQEHSVMFPISESDLYSNSGQFLRRKLTQINLSTASGISLTINRAVLTSPFAY